MLWTRESFTVLPLVPVSQVDRERLYWNRRRDSVMRRLDAMGFLFERVWAP